MPDSPMNSRMTTISLVSGVEVDTTHSVKIMDGIMGGAIQEGKPILVVPTVTGEAHLVAHQIVGWWPKSSGGARPASGSKARSHNRRR
jgi:hypothetical protein